jgi:error-prone DNA polymerase
MLNAWPLGFYSPATLVKDAQRHGVRVLPIDAVRSEWKCTLERSARGVGDLGVRLGLRYVSGLSEASGARIAAERAAAPFASLADFAKRAAPRRHEIEALAESGALASLDPRAGERRAALWQVTALERDPSSLLAGVPPPDAEREVPLAALSPLETTLANYRTTGLTTGPHVMAHLRPALRARGVLAAAELRSVPNGRFVRTAGHVIVRQRPGAAKGFCFVTLEDETGTANGVLTPDRFERLRGPLHAAELLEIAGPIQNADGVIHVRVREVRPLAVPSELPASHDYR